MRKVILILFYSFKNSVYELGGQPPSIGNKKQQKLYNKTKN